MLDVEPKIETKKRLFGEGALRGDVMLSMFLHKLVKMFSVFQEKSTENAHTDIFGLSNKR